jgi:hypothetical protein
MTLAVVVSLQHVLHYAMCYYRETIGVPQCSLAASHGYKIARQFITLRLPKGAVQKGQQSKLTVRGLD